MTKTVSVLKSRCKIWHSPTLMHTLTWHTDSIMIRINLYDPPLINTLPAIVMCIVHEHFPFLTSRQPWQQYISMKCIVTMADGMWERIASVPHSHTPTFIFISSKNSLFHSVPHNITHEFCERSNQPFFSPSTTLQPSDAFLQNKSFFVLPYWTKIKISFSPTFKRSGKDLPQS